MKRLLASLGFAGLVFSAAANANAQFRVIHASPDTPAVDVIINDDFSSPLLQDVPFTGVSNFFSVPAGAYNAKVVPANQTTPVAINANLLLADGVSYSVAATDLFANITPRVFVDDNTLDSANARVRFIHLSPGTPNVDINLAGTSTTIFGNVAFGDSGGYRTVPAGAYQFDANVAGTSTTALTTGILNLEANTVYTVYAMGLLNGSGAQALQAVVSVDAVPEPGTLALLGLAALSLVRRR